MIYALGARRPVFDGGGHYSETALGERRLTLMFRVRAIARAARIDDAHQAFLTR